MKIVIDGIPPWDGDYEFDDFSFTNRELYEIRQISGLRAAELIEALDANDTAAFVGIAKVILGRHGKRLDVNDLWDAEIGSITMDLGLEEEPDPTTSAAEGVTSSGTDGGGTDGDPGGENHRNGLSPTGNPSSETSAISVPVTSEI